jgi:hypothetical protein
MICQHIFVRTLELVIPILEYPREKENKRERESQAGSVYGMLSPETM